MSEQAKSGRTIVIVAILIVAIGGTGAWYFLSYKPEQEAIEKARLEQVAKAQAEQKRKEQAAQKKAKYDQLIADADEAFAQSNWQQAQSLYSQASGLYSDQQYPQDQLALVNAELDAIAAKEARVEAGIIERISAPTGRFYVVVSSSIDDDLAMDFATKLSKEGNDVKIVEHELKGLSYFGVSVGDYDTWDQALAASQSVNVSDSGAWVLKN